VSYASKQVKLCAGKAVQNRLAAQLCAQSWQDVTRDARVQWRWGSDPKPDWTWGGVWFGVWFVRICGGPGCGGNAVNPV